MIKLKKEKYLTRIFEGFKTIILGKKINKFNVENDVMINPA
jgi:hypothetical protein